MRSRGHPFVTPVRPGLRVDSFFGLQSMIRNPHGRSTAFDLDTAIQALMERLGDLTLKRSN